MRSDARPLPPMVAGRYRLTGYLGRGGMADVYRAVDTRLGREVAVKVFRAGTDPRGRDRFEAEARLLARLTHPGLVTVHDAGAGASELFLVMQLIDGQPLTQRLAAGPLPVPEVVDLGRRLTDVLAYVHHHGIVHRDVKPSNILLDRDGGIFLADFGISRLVDTRSDLTATGLTVGTFAYMAPEQVRGTGVTPATDVYALGLVLLEALTGHSAHPGSGADTALARLHQSPQIPAGLPAPLPELLAAMIATAPDARPSMAQCRAALGDATTPVAMLAPTRVAPAAMDTGRGTQLLPRRRRWQPAWLGVAAAVLLALLAAVLLSSGNPTTPPVPTTSTFHTPAPSPTPTRMSPTNTTATPAAPPTGDHKHDRQDNNDNG